MQLILSDDLTEEAPILLGTGKRFTKGGVDFPTKEVIKSSRLPFDNPKDSVVQKLNTQLRERITFMTIVFQS